MTRRVPSKACSCGEVAHATRNQWSISSLTPDVETRAPREARPGRTPPQDPLPLLLLHGGRGYTSAYPVERLWRDIQALRIYEGTSMIQKTIIGRMLGE